MATIGGKKLNQLRVVDLRSELEKRGLDKSGLKGVLVERLEKSLLEESAELDDSSEQAGAVGDVEETKRTPNGDLNEEGSEMPEDFSGFIVLDSGDDSDELEKAEEKMEEGESKLDDEVLVVEKSEEVNEDVELVEIPDEDKIEREEDEASVEFEYQDAEAGEEAQEEHEEDEKVEDAEESKVEEAADEADVSSTKPNENQLSLSMCVNTDDVQDDLDEDLKEMEKDDAVEDEGMEEEEANENTEDETKEVEASEDVAEGEDGSGESGVKAEDITAVDAEEKNTEEVKMKVEAEVEDEETIEKEKEDEGKEDVEKEDKKDVKNEVKKEEKKDVKSVKKEEPAAKKAAVKKEEKKVEKKVEVKEDKKPDEKKTDEKKTSADAKKSGADAKKKESGKSLWVSNLSSMTRAADLKTRFSQYGKVVGAKIVMNSKSPGGQCFGLVTMSTSEEAAKCIQHLHRTEMHGRSITVDRAKGDRLPSAAAAATAKKTAAKKEAQTAAAKAKEEKAAKEKEKGTEKKVAENKTKDKSDEKAPTVKSDGKTSAKTGKDSDAKGEKGKTDSKAKSSSAKKDGKEEKSSSHRRGSPGLKSLDDVRRERRERHLREKRERERRERLRRERERQIREKQMERERERMRQRERERRRLQLLREREERERQERLRLERERMRQRELERQRERERQERERLRLLQERQLREERERLERERERLERERLQRMERERLERQRAEERRGVKRPADPYTRGKSPTRGPGYWPDTKRAAPERSNDGREFFSGVSTSRDRGARVVPEARPVASRERRSDPRGSHSTRAEIPRDEHRRSERDRSSASRSGREAPRERESRDRRASWEHGTQTSSDPQKGLSLLLQRAGVGGILGDVGASSRSSLPKPVGPPVGSSSRERPGESWNGRSSAHTRPVISSHTLEPPGNPVPRVGRPAVMSEPGRGWPSSAEKEHERSRERDRLATRDMSRSAWSGSSTNPVLLPATHSIDRSRQVLAPSRGSALPPRMMSQHSAPPPMAVPIVESRRPVAMSGRSDPFRSAAVPTIPRSGAMRRY